MASSEVGANRDSSQYACDAGAAAAVGAGRGTTRSGSTPSTNSGASHRPQPRDRPPPKPESASSRNADWTGARQRASAGWPENETTVHSPAPALNSRQAVECGATPAPKRSTAALERTPIRKGPPRPWGTRHSLCPSSDQRSSSGTPPLSRSSTSGSGMNFAPFQRTLGEAAGGHTLLGGTTNPVSP